MNRAEALNCVWPFVTVEFRHPNGSNIVYADKWLLRFHMPDDTFVELVTGVQQMAVYDITAALFAVRELAGENVITVQLKPSDIFRIESAAGHEIDRELMYECWDLEDKPSVASMRDHRVVIADVESITKPGHMYMVTKWSGRDWWHCTCPSYHYRNECSHVNTVRNEPISQWPRNYRATGGGRYILRRLKDRP